MSAMSLEGGDALLRVQTPSLPGRQCTAAGTAGCIALQLSAGTPAGIGRPKWYSLKVASRLRKQLI